MELTRKHKGDLAELKAIQFLFLQGYDVYTPLFDNGPLDLVAGKDGILYRCSVKYTNAKTPSGKWRVALATVSIRTTGNTVVKGFNSSLYDLLLVYVGGEDRVIAIPTVNLTNTKQLNIEPLEDS